MKEFIGRKRSLKALVVAVLPLLVIFASNARGTEESLSFQRRRTALEKGISDCAQQYVGIPCRFGKGLRQSGSLDNSHLFCLIYHEAAKRAGLRFKGYMPMKELLKNTDPVQRDELKNGDLIVLNDGHAALIYRVENQDKLYILYASQKRGRVISFNSHHVVFEVYWLRNLKGFFRLTGHMFGAEE